MMEWIEFIRFAHVLGACVLIGTGGGIAFFMLMAHRSGDADHIARTARIVVVADMVFTATAAILQPITGLILAHATGWSLTEGWLIASVLLYVFIGLFWIPVIFIQIKLRDEARQAARQTQPLGLRYHLLFRIWFACGIPAFSAILVLLWLMMSRPDFDLWIWVPI